MAYKQLCRYKVDLGYYEFREIPPEVGECNYRYSPRQTLMTEIKRYVAEFGTWDKDWDAYDLRERIKKGWRFFTFRPKLGIRGWVWVSPRGKVEDLYVSKPYRGQGWGELLFYQALNSASESKWPTATLVCDAWNNDQKYLIEHLLFKIHCKVKIEGFEIKKYNKRKIDNGKSRKRYSSWIRANGKCGL